MTYNGWKNWETWNVSLWINNDEGLYREARRYRHQGYKAFAQSIAEIMPQTPDGVAWDDRDLDIDALDEMLLEL